MLNDDNEEFLLRSVALQTAQTILSARLRAERVLEQTKADLEDKARQLEHSLSVLRATSSSAASKSEYRKAAVPLYLQERIRKRECRSCVVTEKTPLKIFTARPDGAKDYFNENWLKYSGLDLADLVGWEWIKLLHVEDFNKSFNHWKQCVNTGEPFRTEERLKQADGDYRWHVTHAVPTHDMAGRIWMWVGFCMDIHEIKTGVEEARQLVLEERGMRKEAERINHSKDEFFSMLSHELRNPLNAILGWSQLILQGNMNGEAVRKGIETIERNARMQNKLVEDLFEMSRIASGKLALELARVDLASIAEAIVQSALPVAETKQVRLRKVIDGEINLVLGDNDRLQQVMWNLLSNAIKFTPAGGEVEILVRRVASRAEIRIKDSGIGIKPEFLPYVFDRFRQADSPSGRQHLGLGLGLAIVKELVLLHRGTVEAESEGEGKGSTFIVSIPLIQHRDTGTGIGQLAKITGPLEDAPLPLTALTLLVIDDDRDSLEVANEVLTKQGGEVIMASGAAEGLELLKSRRPHVVICDISMPGKNGYQFIREVRSLPKSAGGQTPAIALTGFARPEDRTKAMIAGYQKHVVKPVNTQKLMIAVSDLVSTQARPRTS
jgi:PAS domain S-box-containing protein